MTLPTSTYRLQLREGMDFKRAEGLLPHLRDLGISHLYLSPVFTATSGSTHGYDVTDPAEIDPTIGGRAGFASLSRAAEGMGIGVILDIVPNHTAFVLENPWLRDVLRHGEASRYARHFDIDWGKGRLVLPMLTAEFDTVLEEGRVRIEEEADGPVLSIDGALKVPLAPEGLPSEDRWQDAETLREVHAAQAWRLTRWEYERDGVTHRRFFNVTSLIGMRVEDPAVFEDMHRLLFDLIDEGLVQGVRVDHIDGLADPTAYLNQLRAKIGDIPLWIEKIVVGDEALPDWPVEGTTGYEAARAIARILTDAAGLGRLDGAWRRETGREGRFEEALSQAKGEVLRQELAAELHQLIDLAREATQTPEGDQEVGDEALREAIIGLLVQFPRYRTYFDAGTPNQPDTDLMKHVAEEAAQDLRSDDVVQRLTGLIVTPENDAARRLQTRFQQVTGALIAKAQEDTAGFRWNRYLAANEVGAEPDEAYLTVEEFGSWLETRGNAGLTLTSTHDTKRAEDARMRLVAISHLPEAFLDLWDRSLEVAPSEEVDPNLRWYILQVLLAIWEPREDIGPRLAQHVEKAMREAKEVTTWTHPDEEAEAAAQALTATLVEDWHRALPQAARELIARGQILSLAQVALKCAMPGIPDIYQGCEGGAYHLTDPDNRLAVDWEQMQHLAERDDFAGRKCRLTMALLDLRRRFAGMFETAGVRVEAPSADGLRLIREGREGVLTVDIALGGGAAPRGAALHWPTADRDADAPVAIRWAPAVSDQAVL
ncbi:malto-oligosyltrehalose synthase [Pseudoroseicyclus aestuarii]|uniref:Maltooligosyl trehalose synthase n=1 Tax=Pseudoroseicyclus aestuarii TaxID=1795041 RepID=A0A318T0S3_9RHOB|nr:malto-oligosyltrehalose synthase [Pseudoroseicyclus aestuarii]PYE83784.1 maltooligosyl trehalose synthase [Pseudoroseicyclus aestuarii]